MHPDWQVLIRGARVFDGTGGPSTMEDIAIADGKIAARGPGLPPDRAERVVDATGRWLMPGLLDIHTHLDLEVDLEPGLPEVVRHGTTTVLVGNCSLGTCFGRTPNGEQNPIVDCFTRVENMPKSVLRKVVDRIDWAHDRRVLFTPRPVAARSEHRAVAAAFDAAHRSHGQHGRRRYARAHRG